MVVYYSMMKNTSTLSRNCDHTRLNSRWINDGYGIPLARVCDKCEDAQLARFRPDIMSRYDHDEPLDEEW